MCKILSVFIVIYDIFLPVPAGTEPLKETAAMNCRTILLIFHVFVSVFFGDVYVAPSYPNN
jgi:hypothetical protein